MRHPQHWLPEPDHDDWRMQASCASVGSDPFFPEPGPAVTASTRQALRVCQACPVVDRCLEYALSTDQRYGIWGGTTETERAHLKGRKRP